MSDAPAQTFLSLLRGAFEDGSLTRLVLTRPRPADADLRKVSARLLRLKRAVVVSFVETHRTRDLTRNLAFDAAARAVGDWLATGFEQAHLFTTSAAETQLLISRKGRQTLLRGKQRPGDAAPAGAEPSPASEGVGGGGDDDDAAAASLLAAHDRVKRRPIDVGRPYLSALGVTDGRQQLIPAMARKWKQINKFIEVLDHALGQTGLLERSEVPVEVLDFGSGKGYLTFATHDHLCHTLGLPARVTGVDLKADMIELCNRAAARVGAQGLAFELGDVASRPPQRADVMIALHACDTATDHAIHAGLRAGASVIMCSPCCHKELRPQLLSPHPLRPILRHGVHLGQQAEMLTDGLRALLLEACGYDTQVFEFVSPEHTSKNKMILAIKQPAGHTVAPHDPTAIWRQVDDLKAFYGIRAQCLETLLRGAEPVLPPTIARRPGEDEATARPASLSRTARS